MVARMKPEIEDDEAVRRAVAAVVPSLIELAGHYLLEDQAGAPIICPLCHQLDGWQIERDSRDGDPVGFRCTHEVAGYRPAGDGRIAWVRAERVGGYLSLAALVSAAA